MICGCSGQTHVISAAKHLSVGFVQIGGIDGDRPAVQVHHEVLQVQGLDIEI